MHFMLRLRIGRGRTILARGVGKPLSMSQISWWCWASTLDWVRAFLASTVIVGDVLAGDLRAEKEQLRAELNLLKTVVRRGLS